MAYINIDTMEYPRFPGDIELNPTANWQEVEETEIPAIEDNQVAYQLTPENIGGKWKSVWTVRDLTEEEIKLRLIMSIREKVKFGSFLSQEEANLLVEQPS
jgi:hypothetical protein